MATIKSIKNKGEFIKKQTGIGSVTNEVVGQQFVDVSEVLDREVAALSKLGVLKTYSSVSEMDKYKVSPVGDDGELILHGQLVAVLNTSSPNENGLYSYCINDGVKSWKKRSDVSIPTDSARKGGYEGTLKDLNEVKVDKIVNGQNVVYGSIATAVTEAQKDSLVNVGLLNTEIEKVNWHIRNIEERDFNFDGYWSVDGSILPTATYMRTPLFKVKKGQRFKNLTGSSSIYAASATFFDNNNKYIIGFDSSVKETEAPEDGYVGFSKIKTAPDKKVYVTQDFWMFEQDNLVAEYTHTINKEVRIESVNFGTNTFISSSHGLVDGDRLAINFKTNMLETTFVNVIPIKTMVERGLYVINAANDTFQLSKTANGTPIMLVNSSTVNLSLFWFEVVLPINVTFSNLELYDGIVEINGVFNSVPMYVSILYKGARAGSRGYNWLESARTDVNEYGYGYRPFAPGYALCGSFRTEFFLNQKQGILHMNKTCSLLRFTETQGVMKFLVDSHKTLTFVPNADKIDGLYLSDGLTLLNGAIIKILKK